MPPLGHDVAAWTGGQARKLEEAVCNLRRAGAVGDEQPKSPGGAGRICGDKADRTGDGMHVDRVSVCGKPVVLPLNPFFIGPPRSESRLPLGTRLHESKGGDSRGVCRRACERLLGAGKGEGEPTSEEATLLKDCRVRRVTARGLGGTMRRVVREDHDEDLLWHISSPRAVGGRDDRYGSRCIAMYGDDMLSLPMYRNVS